jgi:RND family efflux transporter MFP subunit
MLSVAAITSLLIFALITTSCSGGEKVTPSSPEVVRGVATTSIQRANVPDYFEALGTVRAAQSSQIASQMMGNLVEIRVHEGDRVARGQVLAVIDDAQPRAALDRATAGQTAAQQEVTAAESDLRLAEVTYKRYQDLYSKKSVSPQEFDEIKTRLENAQARRDMSQAAESQARAALAQARTSLEYSRVRAPFDGVVTQKMADAGTLAAPGMPLFTVEDPHRFRLEASVDESNLHFIKVGQPITVRMDALQSELAGKVAQIVPAADAASRSFLVKIDLPTNVQLHSGLFGRAQISRGEKNAVLAPASSVVERGQLKAVYVVDASQVAGLRYVTLGNTFGKQVETLSGLDGGEKVVAAPGDRELAGKKIEVQP